MAGFRQMLDYLDVLGSHSEVQRGVALVVFYVNKGFLHLGQNLYNFKTSNLACNVHRSFTLLSSSVDIREFFDQQFDHILTLSFDSIMQGLKILFVLEIDICTLVLILHLIEKVTHYSQVICLDSLNELLIPYKLGVPPVLPRGLVRVLQKLSNSPLLLQDTHLLQVFLLILDHFFYLFRQP